MDVIETEVLIIGAGMAGIAAAIYAHDHGATPLLLTKGAFGRDGAATWTAGYGFQSAVEPPDSPEVHAEDTVRTGRYMNNQELVVRLVNEIPRLHRQLDEWGMKYRKENGKYVMTRFPGSSHPRVPLLQKVGEWVGHEYRRVLIRQVSKRHIQVVEDLFAIDFLRSDGEVVGVLGLDLRRGELIAFVGAATILASGGHMGSYRVTTIPQAFGDGCAMAYKAGAAIMDMEFADFYTYTAIWPPITEGDIWPSVLKYDLHAKLLNSEGEDFMKRYTGADRIPPLAVLREVRAGRGSAHGGAYLSVRHHPKEVLEKFFASLGRPHWLKRLKEIDFDFTKEDVEVAPAGIVSFGGCKIDVNCLTDVPRLYAVGEVAAGREGAYTNAGNTLPLCLAMGALAGRHAAEQVKGQSTPAPDETEMRNLGDDAFAPLRAANGLRPIEVKDAIQDILENHGGLLGRSASSLTEGLRKIRQVRAEQAPRLCTAAKPARYNREWMEALEVRNMAVITELILRAALLRTESRGLHFRDDYPAQDPAWLKHIVFKNGSGEPAVSYDPVTFPYFTPPAEDDADG